VFPYKNDVFRIIYTFCEKYVHLRHYAWYRLVHIDFYVITEGQGKGEGEAEGRPNDDNDNQGEGNCTLDDVIKKNIVSIF